MKYKLEDITIKVIDVAAGGPLPEHDYRFEAIADNGTNKTSITFARGSAFSADYILRYLNQE